MSVSLQSVHVVPQQRSRTSGSLQGRTPNAVNFAKLSKNFHMKNNPTPYMCLVAKKGGNLPTCGVEDKDGFIIVNHGSRRKESNLMLNEFVSMFKEKTIYPIVESAHMDIPKLAHDVAIDFPSVSYLVTSPLGLHSLLVDVVNDRINYCLNHASGSEGECLVCVGTGK